MERINQDLTILPGYNLELTELDTGTCDQGYPSDALFQFVNEITQEEQIQVGVVGAFCSTLAKVVALIAERSGTNLPQILVSPSPALHDRVRYPHLFHIISSSAVYGEAVCSLIEQFGWTRVGVVSDNSMEHSYPALVNMLGGNVAFYPFRDTQWTLFLFCTRMDLYFWFSPDICSTNLENAQSLSHIHLIWQTGKEVVKWCSFCWNPAHSWSQYYLSRSLESAWWC